MAAMQRNRFIPLEKQSKKAQRAYHAKQRGSWNGTSPVTKLIPSGKIYTRKKGQHNYDED